MRIVAYEWCSSGGLSGPDATGIGDGHMHERLLREGWAMLEAIEADAARDASLDVTVLMDETMLHRVGQVGASRTNGLRSGASRKPASRSGASRKPEARAERDVDVPSTPSIFLNSPLGSRLGLPYEVGLPREAAFSPPRAAGRRLSVRRGGELDALVTAAREADWTIIVAPETDGILESRVAAVRSAGGRVLASHEAFLAIASDKQATIDCLAAAGIAVPAGRSIEPLEPVPVGFRMPAVRKDRRSAGGDGLVILRTANVAPSRAAARLETLTAGTPVGVAVLCGPNGLWPLPPMRQRFSEGDVPRYLGSEPLQDDRGVERAIQLARRAIAATLRAAAVRDPAAGQPCGWVGVDMILGSREDSSDDRVLEINPRLTTSFVGLSAGQSESLVAAMVAITEGRGPAGCGDWKPGVAFSLD